MTPAPISLPVFEQAKLRAERVRIYSMSVLVAAFILFSLFRVIFPSQQDETRSTAIAILILSLGFLAFEAVMLRLVSRAIAGAPPPSRWLGRLHAWFECLFPVVVLLGIMLLHPTARFTLLVSPGYAFMLLLIGVSVLRVDMLATILIGLFTTTGYAVLVIYAVAARPAGMEDPHPPTMYVNLSFMLAMATVLAAFMTRQVREYVLAAVREMETRRQRDRLLHDLEIASEIQKGLQPKTTPRLKEYDLAASCKPADQTGGDYFDWQEISRNRLVISLGDVTGHGIGPALVTAACRAYVRAIIADNHAPAATLQRVNQLLRQDVHSGRFVTLALLDFNPDGHEMFLLSAGHGPTLHLRASDGRVIEFPAQGPPLAVIDEQVLDEPAHIQIAPGDLVVLLSDGFLEQHNASRELFGVKRLGQVLLAHRESPAAVILSEMEAAVRHFAGDVAQEDDRTAIIIKRLDGNAAKE